MFDLEKRCRYAPGSIVSVVLASALSLAIGGIAAAEESDAKSSGPAGRAGGSSARPLATDDFGVSDLGITVIPYSAFFPAGSGTTTYLSGTGVSGKRWLDATTSGGSTLVAPLQGVPNGATLVRVDFYVDDGDPAEDIVARLVRNSWEADTGANPTANFLFTISSSGSPGPTVITAMSNALIRYDGNVDADPATEVVGYNLTVDLQKASSDLAIRAVRLLWRRNLSPAPHTATFGDVPTDHPFFRHIEALFDAGITSGCQVSPLLYCPGQAVTRGEMAVFLAKALGLHWPAQ